MNSLLTHVMTYPSTFPLMTTGKAVFAWPSWLIPMLTFAAAALGVSLCILLSWLVLRRISKWVEFFFFPFFGRSLHHVDGDHEMIISLLTFFLHFFFTFRITPCWWSSKKNLIFWRRGKTSCSTSVLSSALFCLIKSGNSLTRDMSCCSFF